jgi:hypothetical protein
MDLSESPQKPEVTHVTILVTTIEGDVDEIRAFAEIERAREVRDRIHEKKPWKETEMETFHVLANLEDVSEQYRAWKLSQMEDGE